MDQHRPAISRTIMAIVLLMIVPGFAIDAATITVPLDHATIQGAVSTANAGDTIRILAGTYREAVNITKSLVFLGAGPDSATVIEAPDDFGTNTGYDFALNNFYTRRAIVHVGAASVITVTISGITVDGRRLGPAFDQNRGYCGILADRAILTLKNSTIENVLPADSVADTWDPNKVMNGRGIEVRGDSSAATITGCLVRETNRYHILINAGDLTDGNPVRPFPVATITQDTIVGKGLYHGGQKGIWLNNGAYGTVAWNVVSNFDYTGTNIEPDRATEVIVWGGYLNENGITSIHHNTLTASSYVNNKGIYCQGTYDSIYANTITGFRMGVEIQGEIGPFIARNVITGGICGLMINDPAAGRPDVIVVGGSPENKNVIKGQIDTSLGGRAIMLGYRDPLDQVWLQSPVPVNAAYNDFGVYTNAEIRGRIWCRGDTTLDSPFPLDTVLFTPFYVPELTVGVKAYLQGAYTADGDSMLNTLGTSGVLAEHFGAVPVPALAVDSITIELRDSLTAEASTRRHLAPAWLMTDGSVRSFADTTKHYVTIADSLSGTYYLVVRHRNHLAVMSAAQVPLEYDTLMAAYDFGQAAESAFGEGGIIQAGAHFALIGGDANGDGQVTSSDFNEFNPKFVSAATGYEVSDWNLDGQVTSTDFNLFNPNFTTAKATNVP